MSQEQDMEIRLDFFGVSSEEAAPLVAELRALYPALTVRELPQPPAASPPFSEFSAFLITIASVGGLAGMSFVKALSEKLGSAAGDAIVDSMRKGMKAKEARGGYVFGIRVEQADSYILFQFSEVPSAKVLAVALREMPGLLTSVPAGKFAEFCFSGDTRSWGQPVLAADDVSEILSRRYPARMQGTQIQSSDMSGHIRLRVTLDEARRKISEQIEKGRAIKAIKPNSWDDLHVAEGQAFKWREYTRNILRSVFVDESACNSFARMTSNAAPWSMLPQAIAILNRNMDRDLTRLESILESLDFAVEPSDYSRPVEREVEEGMMDARVFVVHSRTETRQSVARVIEKLGLKAIILEEQATVGLSTLLEKIERYSDVQYAVVLMTPDDVGGLRGDAPRERARQNVIFELGYFAGRLGRGNVCLMKANDLEIPSDLGGVGYIPLNSGGWEMKLAKELKNSGLSVDVNKLIE